VTPPRSQLPQPLLRRLTCLGRWIGTTSTAFSTSVEMKTTRSALSKPVRYLILLFTGNTRALYYVSAMPASRETATRLCCAACDMCHKGQSILTCARNAPPFLGARKWVCRVLSGSEIDKQHTAPGESSLRQSIRAPLKQT
jgi:hypothetical protein